MTSIKNFMEIFKVISFSVLNYQIHFMTKILNVIESVIFRKLLLQSLLIITNG